MKRELLFKYAREHFKSEPEYLWLKYPDYAVLRHNNNGHWFCVVMSVPSEKLGLKTNDKVDILNIKVRPEYVGSLRQMEGVFPAYHMNKEHWISVLLDSPISAKDIYALVTDSHLLTAKGGR